MRNLSIHDQVAGKLPHISQPSYFILKYRIPGETKVTKAIVKTDTPIKLAESYVKSQRGTFVDLEHYPGGR